MSRPSLNALTLSFAGVLVLFLLLPFILHINSWAAIAWAILLMPVTVVIGVLGNLGYAILAMELGHKTKPAGSGAMEKESTPAKPFLKAFPHLKLRHH